MNHHKCFVGIRRCSVHSAQKERILFRNGQRQKSNIQDESMERLKWKYEMEIKLLHFKYLFFIFIVTTFIQNINMNMNAWCRIKHFKCSECKWNKVIFVWYRTSPLCFIFHSFHYFNTMIEIHFKAHTTPRYKYDSKRNRNQISTHSQVILWNDSTAN